SRVPGPPPGPCPTPPPRRCGPERIIAGPSPPQPDSVPRPGPGRGPGRGAARQPYDGDDQLGAALADRPITPELFHPVRPGTGACGCARRWRGGAWAATGRPARSTATPPPRLLPAAHGSMTPPRPGPRAAARG